MMGMAAGFAHTGYIPFASTFALLEQEELTRLFVTLSHIQTQMLNLDYLIPDFQ